MSEFLDRLKTSFGSVGGLLGKMSAGQKWAVGALCAVIAFALVWLLVAGAAGGGEVALFEDRIPPSSMAAVRTVLETERIHARYADGNAYVADEETKNRAWFAISNADVVPREARDFAFLEQASLTDTSENRKQKLWAEMQRRLARQIESIAVVRKAEVNITEPNEHLFEKAYRPAKAAVQVELEVGAKLSKENVLAIARSVANSVKNLDPGNVVVTDTKGNIYMAPDDRSATLMTQLDAERERAREFEDKLTQHLGHLFTRFSVSVRVKVGMDTEDTTQLRYDSDNAVPGTVEKRDETEVTRKLVEAPGVPINQKETGDQGAGVVGERTLKESRSTDMKIGQATTTTRRPGGDVKDVTVSITVPLGQVLEDDTVSLADAAQDPAKQALLDLKFEKISAMVRNVCGISAQQARDNITVTAFRFQPPPVIARTWWETAFDATGLERQQLGSIALALIALLALLGLFRFVKRSAPKPVEAVLAEVEGGEPGAGFGAGLPGEGRAVPGGLFAPGVVPADVAVSNWTMEQVVAFMEEEPEKAANIIKRLRLSIDEAEG